METTKRTYKIENNVCITKCPAYPNVGIGSATCGMCKLMDRIDTKELIVYCKFKPKEND